MLIHSFLSRREQTATADVSLEKAVELMNAVQQHHIVLLDDKRPVGILTEHDIMRHYHHQADFSQNALTFASTHLITSHINRRIEYTLNLMLDHNVRHIIVTDDAGLYCGTVVQEEVIYSFEREVFGTHIRVGDILQVIPPTPQLDLKSSLDQALMLMEQSTSDAVLVTKEGLPEGILTENDVMRLARQHVEISTPVEQFMQTPLVEVEGRLSLHETVTLMKRQNIRHIFIKDADTYHLLSSKHIFENMQGNYSSFLESKLRDIRKTFNELGIAIVEAVSIGGIYHIRWLNRYANETFNVPIDAPLSDLIPEPALQRLLQDLRFAGNCDYVDLPIGDAFYHLVASRSNLPGTPLIKLILTDTTAIRSLSKALRLRMESDPTQKAHVHALLDSIPHIAWLKSAEGIYLAVNHSYSTISNIPPEEVIGKNDFDIWPTPLAQKFIDDDKRIMREHKSRVITETITTPTGETRIMETYKSPLFDNDGNVTGTIGFSQNVTDKHQLLKEHEEAATRYQTLFDRSPSSIFITDINTHFVDFNQNAHERLGYTREELLKLKIEDIEANFHDEEILRQIEATKPGGSTDFESQHRRKDGSLMDVFVRIQKVVIDGKVYLQSIADDISERKQVQQQQVLLNALMQNSPDAIFFIDTESGSILDANETALKRLGYTKEEMLSMHMMDISTSCSDFESYHAQQKQWRENKHMLVETKHLCKDGTSIETEISNAFLSMHGKEYALTIARDISEKVKAKKALSLAAKVFDSTIEGIIITDSKLRITDVNPAFTDITGYHEDEVIGQAPTLLKSGKHDREFYDQMWYSIKSSGVWQGEIWNRRKDGSVYPEWLNISTISDEKDGTVNYLGVFSDISQIKQSEEQLNYMAHHDPLTGLPNRLLLKARLEHSISRAHRENEKLGVLFIDLDNFKAINDTYGHSVGDMVIQKLAHTLNDPLREEDTLARVGGDEFIVVLEQVHDAYDLEHICEKILHLVHEPIEVEQKSFTLGASIGIAIYPDNGEHYEELIKNADAAMYKAKDSGRNTFMYYAAEMTAQIFEKLLLDNEMRRAVEADEFFIYYQPQIDLASGEVIGAEALLRWRHQNMGVVPPDIFIPHAESTRLIIPIGEQVLRRVCNQLAHWHEQNIFNGSIAVNISGEQIKYSDLPATIVQVLETSGLNPELLELEVTETFIMENAVESVRMLHELKDLGLKLSIDDFGTGYSSLSYLKQFPIDKLKIDKTFIDGLPNDQEDCAIAGAIIALANSMSLQVLAEGVETQAQADYLVSKGCESCQGYYYGRPMPPQEFEAWLASYTPQPRDGLELL